MFSTLLLSGCSECETEYYHLKHVSKIAKMKEISSYFQKQNYCLLSIEGSVESDLWYSSSISKWNSD